MAKKQLSGSVEEQCDFLYQLAQEKREAGNYTGALYALKEIVKHRPDYQDAAQILVSVRQQKKAQTIRLLVSLLGAILFIGIGSMSGLRNDLWLLALGFIGLLVGYGVSQRIGNVARF